jgi:hypothetical protein
MFNNLQLHLPDRCFDPSLSKWYLNLVPRLNVKSAALSSPQRIARLQLCLSLLALVTQVFLVSYRAHVGEPRLGLLIFKSQLCLRGSAPPAGLYSLSTNSDIIPVIFFWNLALLNGSFPVFPDGPLQVCLPLSSPNSSASKAYRPDSH